MFFCCSSVSTVTSDLQFTDVVLEVLNLYGLLPFPPSVSGTYFLSSTSAPGFLVHGGQV